VSIMAKLDEYVATFEDLAPEGEVLAEVARNLAAELDNPDTSAYVRPNLARQLREVMSELAQLEVG
jgi:hypothetical protein